MKPEISDQPASVIFFRFARPIVLSAWVFTLAAAVCLGAFVLPQAIDGNGLAMFGELLCLGIIWIGQGSILSMSSIVISSTDISKCLLGIRVCTIRWAEIVAAHKMLRDNTDPERLAHALFAHYQGLILLAKLHGSTASALAPALHDFVDGYLADDYRSASSAS